MSHRRVTLTCLWFTCIGSTAVWAQQLDTPRQQARSLETAVTVSMDYLLYVPQDESDTGSWPLLLFLHGAGERGDDLQRVKIHGPPKLIEAGRDFPFIVVSPQCPQGQHWQPAELSALLDHVMDEHAIDPDRVYVTGLSMGGFGTWALARHEPERFAAIAPICGGGENFWASTLKDVPIWAFHGAEDRVVPPHRSEELIDKIRQAGGDPKLTIYPGVGHDSWTATYDNPELYDWLLEHTRSARFATADQ